MRGVRHPGGRHQAEAATGPAVEASRQDPAEWQVITAWIGCASGRASFSFLLSGLLLLSFSLKTQETILVKMKVK